MISIAAPTADKAERVCALTQKTIVGNFCMCVFVCVCKWTYLWQCGGLTAEGCALFLSAASHWQLCLAAAASDWTAGGRGVYWREPILELSLMNTHSERRKELILCSCTQRDCLFLSGCREKLEKLDWPIIWSYTSGYVFNWFWVATEK